MDLKKKILQLFKDNNGYLESKDITDTDIHHRHLKTLEEKKLIYKVKHGLYRLTYWELGDELEDIAHIVPDGILCLLSAWNYHELSNYVPPVYHIAIEKNQKIILPSYPPIQLYYWTKKYWKLGISEVQIGKTTIKIYNKERSVCDAIRFRNKLGKEVEKEVLTNYLKLPDRNINLLLSFAKELRVKTKLTEYLEMLT